MHYWGRWNNFICRGDQPIKINVVVKVGGGTNIYEVPLYFRVGGRTYPPTVPPVAAPLDVMLLCNVYYAINSIIDIK